MVNNVLVSPSSAVAEMCENVSSDSDRECVEPQSFSFSKKRSIVCAENRGEELGRDASKSASGYQKKDDAAHATANFATTGG